MPKTQQSLFPVLLIPSYIVNEDDIKITKEECLALKTELHAIGSANFMRKYIQGETPHTLKETLYAFGYVVV